MHFYHIWVQEKILHPTKELRMLHQILKEVSLSDYTTPLPTHSMVLQFTMPSYLGRLPTLVGIPAGGSLTADQWMLMATVIGPIAVSTCYSGVPDHNSHAYRFHASGMSSWLIQKPHDNSGHHGSRQGPTERRRPMKQRRPGQRQPRLRRRQKQRRPSDRGQQAQERPPRPPPFHHHWHPTLNKRRKSDHLKVPKKRMTIQSRAFTLTTQLTF